jgi:acyl phosphate:glycerol-3-phosphate acyltransferase
VGSGKMLFLTYCLVGVIAYLLGSVPTGYLVAHSHRNVDILQSGSKRTGATNILRTLGWKAALVVFLGDFAKGMAAVAVARLISQSDPTADVIAGLAVMAGHNLSIFIHFKGGRGVTAGVGALAVVAPIAALICAVVAFSTIGLSRYVSLGSILGACSVPIAMVVLVIVGTQPPIHLVFGVVGPMFIVVSHKDNISRLLKGTERKLGQKAQT